MKKGGGDSNLVLWLLPFFLGLFLIPYWTFLPLIFQKSKHGMHWDTTLFWSLGQSLVSTFLTLVAGTAAALGLLWTEKRWSVHRRGVLDFAVLLPSLLPALFVVVPVYNVLPFYLSGFSAVVFFHVISQMGLCALLIRSFWRHRLSTYMDEAQLAGASPFLFMRKSFPLWQGDLLQLSGVFFVYFLTSFSVPVLVAGRSPLSLELVIYQKILIQRDAVGATHLFLLQAVMVGLFFLWLARWRTKSFTADSEGSVAPLGKSYFLPLALMPTLLMAAGFSLRFLPGLQKILRQPDVLERWEQYALGSLSLGFLTAGGVFLLLCLGAFFLQANTGRRALTFLNTPSQLMLAFGILLFPGAGSTVLLMKISVALALAFFPPLLRFGLLQKSGSLQLQWDMGRLLGASEFYLFRKITWPQSLPTISLLSGLGGVWAVGDFAFSRILAGRDLSLAMWVQSLVDQYRWDLALVLSASVLLCGWLVFTFFWGLSYVARQKLD